MRGARGSPLINTSNYSNGGLHVGTLMVPVEGPHGTQGTRRLGKATGQKTEAQIEPSANEQSHLSRPFLSLSQLIRITEQSF